MLLMGGILMPTGIICGTFRNRKAVLGVMGKLRGGRKQLHS